MCAHPSEVSHVRQREIQAPVVVALIRGYEEALGTKRAREIAAQVIREDAVAAGRAMAQRFGGNSMSHLEQIVRLVWAADSAMEIEFLKQNETSLFFDVTHCGYAEAYRRVGVAEYGVCLSCSRDEPFTEGFNPRLRLRRTRTIMEGSDHCDFRYTIE